MLDKKGQSSQLSAFSHHNFDRRAGKCLFSSIRNVVLLKDSNVY